MSERNANSVNPDQVPRYGVCQCPLYGTPGINGLTQKVSFGYIHSFVVFVFQRK